MTKREHSQKEKTAITVLFASGIIIMIINALILLSEPLYYIGIGMMGLAIFIWDPGLAFWIFWVMGRGGGISGGGGSFG
ncbi:MAG: hypothetical protein JXA43_01155, partial [Candidatus Diapherotrites archaeon]|nr:hypothetical protein [Candidatus Diapherotrites archaeon]